MTHEQKPESAEFPEAVRSCYASAKERYGITIRPPCSWEEQAKAMTRMVLDGVCKQRGHDFTAAYLAEHLAEAEARGAAEQRRKDAEGIEISGIIKEVCELPDRSSPEDQPDMMLVTPDELRLILEAAQPANVTALEARVKALEGALKEAAYALERVKDGERGGYNARNGKRVYIQMSDGERGDIIHSEVTLHCEYALEALRAAIREGGEHG